MQMKTNQTSMTKDNPELSVVIPAYNEEDCLSDTLNELRTTLEEAGMDNWEVLIVDDGSHDRSPEIARRFSRDDSRFRLLQFEGNCGQTAAFDAGFRAARGRLVGMMDADGQNDPRDFKRLINALDEKGVDMMCGIRQKRQDSWVRRMSSRIGNGVRNWLTHEQVTDVGCSIRVFRRECIDRIKLFEGMHRFFPTLFRMEGYEIGEIPVNHRPRLKGKSKYGISNRLWRGLKDLMAVRWMQHRTLRYRIRRVKPE